MSREYDFEPVRGLPGALPTGERILWQGAPAPPPLALRAFHLNTAWAYLGACWALAFLAALADGSGLQAGLSAGLWLAAAGVMGGAILAAMAWLYARSTVYTLTNKRLVIRFGLAIPKAINVPFALVESAGVKLFKSGVGDIAIKLVPGARIPFLHLWPNARPGRFAAPEPTLRALAGAKEPAMLLAQALRAYQLEQSGAAAPLPELVDADNPRLAPAHGPQPLTA